MKRVILLVAAVMFCLPTLAQAFPADFDGDGKTDLTVWRPAFGLWYLLPSTGFCPAGWTVIGPGQCQRQWGLPGDIPLVGDFDQDGKGDVTVYRPSNQHFYIAYSSIPDSIGFQFPDGTGDVYSSPSDIPDIADVNDDGRSDIVIYKPAQLPANQRVYARVYANNAITMYSGSLSGHQNNLAVLPVQPSASNYRAPSPPSNLFFAEEVGTAWPEQSSSVSRMRWTYTDIITWGSYASITMNVPNASHHRRARGNFSGFAYDLEEFAAFDQSTGIWRYRRLPSSTVHTVSWGLPGDRAVPGDYNGDGVTDFAVWRPSTGTWFILVNPPCPVYSQPTGYGGCFRQWGLSNDVPVSR